jgi:hypothetical protein
MISKDSIASGASETQPVQGNPDIDTGGKPPANKPPGAGGRNDLPEADLEAWLRIFGAC